MTQMQLMLASNTETWSTALYMVLAAVLAA